MTPNELKQLIYQGDVDKIAEALANLDSSARSKLSKTAADVFGAVDDHAWYRRQESARAKKIKAELLEMGFDPKKMQSTLRDARDTAILAVLGCCPLSALKKVDFSFNFSTNDEPQFPQAALKILDDRRPEWMDELVESWLTPNSDSFRKLKWWFLNQMIQKGICQKPAGQDYYHVMVTHAAIDHNSKLQKLAQQELVESDGFLESDVYRIFEYDTDAFAYDWTGWAKFLKQLVDRGMVEREQIIRCAVRASSNRFRQNTLTGLLKFLDSLSITPAEWQANLDELFAFLHNQTSSVVTFAIKKLKELYKSGAIDPENLLQSLPAVFQCPTKGQPKTALTLIQQVAKKHDALIPLAIGAVVQALDHSDSDVQEKALQLLEQWSDRAHPDHAAAIRERYEHLPKVFVSQASQIADSIDGGTSPTQNTSDSSDSPSMQPLSWPSELDAINEPWRTYICLEKFEKTLKQPVFPPSLKFEIHQVPVLSALKPVTPIRDHVELIDRVAHAIESVDDAMEAELILDGISRLGAVSTDMGKIATPVGKRLNKYFAMGDPQGIASAKDSAQTEQLLRFVLKVPEPKRNKEDLEFIFAPSELDLPHAQFYAARIVELTSQLQTNPPGPLLSAPTHQRGWIDPLVFAKRVAERIRSGSEIGKIDFLLALLRLAPENRDDAIQELPDDDSSWIQLALFACNRPAQQIDGLENCDIVHLHIAAHARTKSVDDSELQRLGLDPKIQHGGPPVQIDAAAFVKNQKKVNRFKTITSHKILNKLYFTGGKYNEWGYSVWRTQMNAWNSKRSNDHYLAYAAAELRGRINDNSLVSEPMHAFFEELFEEDRVWNSMAHLVATLGLIGKSSDAKGQAIDALIISIEDGRADANVLGQIVAAVFNRGLGVPKRLADSLTEICRVSSLHTWFATLTVEPLIASFKNLPTGAADVMELYLNGLLELDLAAPANVIEVCNNIKGSSKSAKVAKRIVAVDGRAHSPKRDEAKSMALQSRLARAQRWQNASRQ